MLVLYPYTLIIGHILLLCILNLLTLQKKMQNCVTNNVFLDKKVKTQQQQNNKNKRITRNAAMRRNQVFNDSTKN